MAYALPYNKWFFIGYWILNGLDFYPAFFYFTEAVTFLLTAVTNQKELISDGQYANK